MRSDDHTARISNSRLTAASEHGVEAWTLVAAVGSRDPRILEHAYNFVAGGARPGAQLALLVLAGLIAAC